MQNERNVTGSAFFFTGEAQPIGTSPRDCRPAAKKVLIFSREAETRVLLETFLALCGCQTIISDCLEESFFIISETKPDLILLDTELPFETNLENIRRIRRFSKETPVIVLSGFSQPQFQRLSLAVGADVFLVKPLDFDLLEDYLQKNIEKNEQKSH